MAHPGFLRPAGGGHFLRVGLRVRSRCLGPTAGMARRRHGAAGRGLPSQKSDHVDPRYRLPVHDVAGRLTNLAKSVSESQTETAGGPTASVWPPLT